MTTRKRIGEGWNFGFGPRDKRFTSGKRRMVRRSPLSVEPLEDRWMLAGDAYEPNDTTDNPRNLGSIHQEILQLSLHEQSDQDWFLWTPSQDGEFSVEVLYDETAANLGLEILNDSGQQIDSSSSSPIGQEQVSVTIGETYAVGQPLLIHVYGILGAAIDNYGSSAGSARRCLSGPICRC